MWADRQWAISLKKLPKLYCILGLWFVGVSCRPLDPENGRRYTHSDRSRSGVDDENWDYLVRYGYVSKDLASLLPTKHVYDQAIKKFADDIGENEIDHRKLTRLMRAPRCSKPLPDLRRRRRGKRFVAHVTKWDHRDIRWRFRDPFEIFQNSTDFDVAKDTLVHAFAMWSLASKYALRFLDILPRNNTNYNSVAVAENETREIDIDIFFATGDHGDHEPFDGRGGIVAHSGYPREGKIHFDASEPWMINGVSGIDLRYVALHETGHALGLRHSKHKGAIMHPIYRTKTREIALSDDDINGIRYLYPADKLAQEKFSSVMIRNRNRPITKKPLDFEDY